MYTDANKFGDAYEYLTFTDTVDEFKLQPNGEVKQVTTVLITTTKRPIG